MIDTLIDLFKENPEVAMIICLIIAVVALARWGNKAKNETIDTYKTIIPLASELKDAVKGFFHKE